LEHRAVVLVGVQWAMTMESHVELTARRPPDREPVHDSQRPPADVVLDRVVKRFGGVTAVGGISLAIFRGEFLSVIGPSGCGKTTTLRLIAGLDQPDEGQIYIQGKPQAGIPPYERNCGVVFQSFALFPHLNVIQNVEFGLKMRGVGGRARRKRAEEALDVVGLKGMETRDISQLSGGQRQRVGIARALVVEPALILLDEPLGSLDAKLRIDMQSELKALQRRMGITFVHVSHNQSEALAMADRIVVMNNGCFEQVGSPADIYSAPQTRFVAEFVGKNNIFGGRVVSADNGLISMQTRDGLLHVRGAVEKYPPGQAVTFIVRADLMRFENEAGEHDRATNRLNVIVQGMEYTGSVVTVVLRLPLGNELKLEQHERLMRQIGPRHGDSLVVRFDPDDAYLLPSTASTAPGTGA
jgi:spermidine/putrescine transport system ATP-binding protein